MTGPRAVGHGREPADSPWWPSVYGADDRIGAGHELTPEATMAALRLARSGRVVELAQLTTADVPVIQPRVHHQVIRIAAWRKDQSRVHEPAVLGVRAGGSEVA